MKSLQKFIIIISFAFLQAASFSEIKFTNECEDEIVKLIDNSSKTLDIAVYSINNTRIVNAISEAKKRGLIIRILTDRIQAFGRGSKVKYLHDMEADIETNTKPGSDQDQKKEGLLETKVHTVNKIMHHKFVVSDFDKIYTNEAVAEGEIDEKIDQISIHKKAKAVQGSFNWTNSASTKNAEDCNIFENEDDIKKLKERFEELWKINSREISECYFKNMNLEKDKRIKCTLKKPTKSNDKKTKKIETNTNTTE